MIPVKLTIKGLYSYKKEHTIDFERLLEGQLFGIFGSVGSGKSTILEAISFALYDQSERLNQKDKRNYNMMNLSSDELLIDFVFRGDKDDSNYRFKVFASRKKNKEEVNSFVRDTYVWKDNGWVAEQIRAEDIIGLSYENFKRTIIIPQGKFQEFLQLTDGDRVKMMKEIFQLSRFDLSDRVGSLLSKNKLAKENLEGQMLHLQAVTRELIDEKEKQREGYSKEIERSSAELEKLQVEERNLEKLKNLFESIGRESDELKDLLSHKERFGQKSKKLELFEQAFRLFSKDLAMHKELKSQEALAQSNLRESLQSFEKLEVLNVEKQKLLAKATEDYSNREQLKKQAAELEVLLQIRKIETEVFQFSTIYTEKDKATAVFQEELQKWEEKEEVGLKKLEETRLLLPDIDSLYRHKSWLETSLTLENSCAEFEKQKNEILQKLDKLKSEFDSNIAETTHQLSLTNPSEKFVNDSIVKYRANIEEKQKSLTLETEFLLSHKKLDEFVQRLHNGESCPLCGSKDHPEIMNINGVESKLLLIAQQREELDRSMALITDLNQKIAVLDSTINTNQSLLSDIEAKRLNALEVLAAHNEKFLWHGNEHKTLLEIDSDIQKARELADLEKKVVEGIEIVRKKLNDARAGKEKAIEEAQKAKQDLRVKETEREILLQQLKTIEILSYKANSNDELSKQIKSLNERYELVERNYKVLEGEVKQLIEELNLLKGKVETLKVAEKETAAKISQLEIILIEKVNFGGFGSLETVQRLLIEDLDVEKERFEIQSYQQKVFAKEGSLKMLQEQVKGAEFDVVYYNRLIENIANLSGQLHERREELARTNLEIEKLIKDLNEKISLETELKAIQVRGENLKLFSNLFRSNGFVNFISSKYLVNLCNAANDRFYKLTRQQLRLEVSENNDFLVRDFLNNGKVRSVKTLSGGQTFQASLCLALAMADSIQYLNKSKQNFFFLDEGFGSQDKESLKIVFEALKSLRKENRIVGLISHVEELQQEIDVYLNVKNDPEDGSVVKGSWE